MGVKLFSEVKLKKLLVLYLYLMIGIIIFFNYPTGSDSVLLINYWVDTLAYFIMTGVFLSIFFKNKMEIFEPIVFISFVYITMFTIVPIIDIVTGEILWFGVDLFKYGVKGTIIAVLGYLMFCFGYTSSIKNKKGTSILNEKQKTYDINKIIKVSVLVWLICFMLSLVYVSSSGMDFAYIFTLGVTGDIDLTQVSATPLGFVSMFSYSLLPTCLIYSNYGKSKSLKILLFLGTLGIQLIRGFRFIIVIFILSHVYFFYLKKEKRPSMKTIAIIAIVFVILIGIMGFYRGAVRSGQSVAWNEFSWDDINEAIFGNFRIYKTYYGIIKAVPSMTPFMYGKQMILYTFVMFIPRALWPEKPIPEGGTAIQLGITKYAALAGTAYPGIGEFYYEFNVFGVIVFMFLFGLWMKALKEKYMLNNKDNFGLMLYSIMVPATLQLIIRGYTPSNFYLIIFLTFPLVIIKKASIKKVNK